MLNPINKYSLTIILLIIAHFACAQKAGKYEAIYSGLPWFDNQGNVVSAHGANIIRDKDKYYLFGEAHTDTSNAFAGFNCYSSADLYNWQFEGLALPPQKSGKLGPNRVGERSKVMKCPKTGEYVMYMHVDTLGYRDQFIGYATSNTITGPYTFKGPLLFNGKSIRKWDMGAFQDKDGSGYVLIHGGEIYQLSEDYKRVAEQLNKSMTSGFESPTMFRKDNLYYFIGSNLTSWERNDNYYYTATSVKGPWIKRGLIAPKGTLTWNSQSTFVLPVEGSKGTTYMFMGDRWSFPKQASSATYVWQPILVSDTSISIPKFHEAWQINLSTGESKSVKSAKKIIENTDKKLINYVGTWKNTDDSLSLSSSDIKDNSFSVKYTGKQVALYGLSRPDGGYARILLKDGKGKVRLSCMVDMYSNYAIAAPKYITPVLPEDTYTLTITVVGEHGNWSDKSKRVYGSKGDFVSFDKIVIVK
ncbi:MAG: family 43 glycosylhydrolase [Pyrinomonadaceae bacterium]|nr:family 43 glycosylhydrolase [Sphingobacteriaceae bacterium]